MIPNMYKIAGELLPCVRSPNMAPTEGLSSCRNLEGCQVQNHPQALGP